MKDFADDNLKFEENGRKLFKLVENTVGKGEIARYEQSEASKGVIVWEWVKTLQKEAFENIVGTGEKCCLQTHSIWETLKFVVWERVK